MSNNLDSYKNAYQNDFLYSLDNELILNWYPNRIIENSKEGSLLELGLGHGYTSINFSKKFEKHTVIEGSKGIIEQFHGKFKNHKINIINEYFEKYESIEKFDVIVMGFIIEHVDEPNLILKKYKQYLNKNGSIFITVPNAEALNKRFGYEAGIIDDIFKLSEGDKALGHKRLFTVDSLRKLVEDEGYLVKNIEGIFLKPITTKQIIDLKLPEKTLNAMLKVGVNYPELCAAIMMEIGIN